VRGDVVQLLAVLGGSASASAYNNSRVCSLEATEARRHRLGQLELELLSSKLWTGRTLSATIGPLVARVSAAMTTPPSNRAPTIVVPVLVAFGSGTPWAWRAALRLWLEKSKPAMAAVSRGMTVDEGGWRR
jgi:hypothetical protein